MWSKLIVLVGLLHPLVHLTSAQGPSCITPNGENGICTYIKRCSPLLDLLQAQGPAAGEYLRKSLCGFDNTTPIVCCPRNTRSVENNVDQPSQNIEIHTTPYGPLSPPHCGFSNASHTRVVGGLPAKLGAWPWIAALGYQNTRNPNQPKYLCGASLISARHVLTAAHCVYRRNDLYTVRIGDLDLNNDNDGAHPVNVLIERKTVHPGYDPSTHTNDIAVIKVAANVPFSERLYPICLPVEESIRNRNLVRSFPFVAGWGSVQYKGPSSSHLLEAQLPVVSPDTCRQAYREFKSSIIDRRVICAGYEQGGKDACQGDSGGPLMSPDGVNFYVVGIVSYGYQCAAAGYPGIYTRVTEFLDFITAEMY